MEKNLENNILLGDLPMIDLTNFKNYLKLNVGSSSSQINYASRVKCYFDEHGMFNQENINAYLSKKLDTISKSTFNGIVTALRHYSTMNNIELVFPKYKKISVREKDYLTEDEITKELLPYFGVVFERKADFFRFIVLFLFYTGVRPDEMESLKTCDVHFDKNLFIVRDPKDHEDKKVPFPNCLMPLMKKYIQEDNIFAFNFKYKTVYNLFAKLNRELRYKKKLNAYMLRHSYAHYLLDNGVPIEKLQILLGHSDLKTTMIYAKPKVTDAINSYLNNIKPRIK